MIWIIAVSFGISIVVGLIIFLLRKIKNRMYKYIPSILFFLLVIYFFIMSKITTDWARLGNIIYFLVSFFTSILTLGIAILFDIFRKRK